jgi:hypothetical protein
MASVYFSEIDISKMSHVKFYVNRGMVARNFRGATTQKFLQLISIKKKKTSPTSLAPSNVYFSHLYICY